MGNELNIPCFWQQKQFEYRFEKMFLTSLLIIWDNVAGYLYKRIINEYPVD